MGVMKLGFVCLQPRHLKPGPPVAEPIRPTSSDRRRLPGCLQTSLVLVFVGLLSLPATAQDQPDIVWMKGGLAGRVLALATAPDGNVVAAGNADSTIKLWRVADGNLARTLIGHSKWVMSVAYSPHGLTLASVSTDKSIRLWGAADGALLRTLTGHSDFVMAVAFSPDGRHLASGSDDTTVRLWRPADDGIIAQVSKGRSIRPALARLSLLEGSQHRVEQRREHD
jgi:WD40 repeat protein